MDKDTKIKQRSVTLVTYKTSGARQAFSSVAVFLRFFPQYKAGKIYESLSRKKVPFEDTNIRLEKITLITH